MSNNDITVTEINLDDAISTNTGTIVIDSGEWTYSTNNNDITVPITEINLDDAISTTTGTLKIGCGECWNCTRKVGKPQYILSGPSCERSRDPATEKRGPIGRFVRQ
jgi:hypothetical protein